MDITTSSFFLRDYSADRLFRAFYVEYLEKVVQTPTNKFVVGRQIDKIAKLQSSTTSKYIDADLVSDSGIVNKLVASDEVISALEFYFNESGRPNAVKKYGLIQLHVKGFLDENLHRMNINDRLKSNDGRPIIDIIKEDIEEIRNNVANDLTEFFGKYPELIKYNIGFRDIYLVEGQYRANTVIRTVYEDEIGDTNKFMQAREDLLAIANKYRREYNPKRRLMSFNQKFDILPERTLTNNASAFKTELSNLLDSTNAIEALTDRISICGLN